MPDKKSLVKLSNWEQAKKAIELCKTIDEVKQIRDQAEILRAYAKQAKESLEVQNNVAEIKLRAERKIGEFSSQLPIKQGARTDLTSSHDGEKLKVNILKEAGIKHSERYEAMASLPDDIFEEHIKQIKQSNEELTTVGIIKVVRELKRQKNQEMENVRLETSTKYRIIYADPPWSYGNNMPSYFKEQKDHYRTMSLEEICNIPIRNICENNAVLFLWVTSPILEESFQVINAWGFKYKASFVWDKIKHNLGHYNSVRHEFLLIAVKGSCQPDIVKLFDSVISVKRMKHSEKPEVFREIIDTLYPHGKRIELFARKKHNNWDAYGNEI